MINTNNGAGIVSPNGAGTWIIASCGGQGCTTHEDILPIGIVRKPV